jgi:very-short-patch-repair endonuclease
MRGKCTPRTADRVLAALAERQHGVVGRQQLLVAGITSRAIEERLGRRLHPIHRGVYAVGYRALRVEGRWMAAVLASGPGAMLSHFTAGQHWGLIARSGRTPEVTRPKHFRARRGIRAHRSPVPEDEQTVVDGIPVTTIPRTILDLAAVASPRLLERAFNEVEVQGLTDPLSIPDLLARYPRRQGSSALRAFLERARFDGVTKNDLEEGFVSLVDSYGLPRPRFNADISVGGRFLCVDCLWQPERLIVELDGRETHGTRRAFESDRERDRLLIADGWQVMRVTWRQLHDQAPAIAADIRRTLATRRTLH